MEAELSLSLHTAAKDNVLLVERMVIGPETAEMQDHLKRTDATERATIVASVATLPVLAGEAEEVVADIAIRDADAEADRIAQVVVVAEAVTEEAVAAAEVAAEAVIEKTSAEEEALATAEAPVAAVAAAVAPKDLIVITIPTVQSQEAQRLKQHPIPWRLQLLCQHRELDQKEESKDKERDEEIAMDLVEIGDGSYHSNRFFFLLSFAISIFFPSFLFTFIFFPPFLPKFDI